jgi:hypothetical protein
MSDVADTGAQPVMMTDAYVELGGVNLKCLTLEISLAADPNPIELTTMCGRREFPGAEKYHFVAKFAQSFDPGGTHEVLSKALADYRATGAKLEYKVRPMQGRGPAAPDNPEFSGQLTPQAYTVFGGTAGAASEVDIDWTADGPPIEDTGTPPTNGNGAH